MNRIMFHIYTDGGCRPNPGRGAWALAVVDPADLSQTPVFEQGGVEDQTTNNRMELCAMRAALQYCSQHPDQSFVIFTDSRYVQQGLLNWVLGWIKGNWKSAAGTPVLNQDLWKELHGLHVSIRNVTIDWTKGHADDTWNNYVDERCTDLITTLPVA
jgi:ribonuclease HI